MPLDVIELALKGFENAGGIVFKRKVEDPDAILRVSETFELELPDSFREFYTIYDCIAYGPEELLSIEQIVEHYELLQTGRRSIRRTYLPFIADGSGGYYAIVCRDVRRARTSEFGTVVYLPGCQPIDVEYKAASFSEFLLSRIAFWKEDI